MDLRRLRAGEWIVAVSGAVLIVSLFLPWYEVAEPAGPGGRHAPGTAELTAWEAYSAIDVLLLALGVLAVGLLILTAVQRTGAVGIAADALLTILASVVTIVTVIRVLDIPGALEGSGEVGLATFAWVGLVAVLGVLGGALVAMRDERLSRPGKHTDASGKPVPPPPEVETLPAPARGAD